MRRQYDGFWFPPAIRDTIVTSGRPFEYLHFQDGKLLDEKSLPPRQDDGLAQDVEAITVRWPRLDQDDWQQIIGLLQNNQQHLPVKGWHQRLLKAMHRTRDLWGDRSNPLRQDILQALTLCTGHSTGMLDTALSLLDLIAVDDLQRAASSQLPNAVKAEYVGLDGLAGRIRFFPEGRWSNVTGQALLQVDSYRRRPWRMRPRPTDLLLGYAAGNVPGTGLLLILLGLAAAVGDEIRPPVIMIKNSSREPLFTPLVLTALELVDPALVSTTLVTLWDYTDESLQEYLVAHADLVVAAASDETIQDIDRVVKRFSSRSRPVRFHQHGHKVSFSTIGRESLAIGRTEPDGEDRLIDVVALLAALDVAFWNQQGCLSSRVHFVERGSGQGYHSPEEYGRAVVSSLRTLNEWLPKQFSRKRQIHNLFDKYQAIAASRGIEVLSGYDDDFLVLLQRQAPTAEQFREIVNDCQERTVAIIPVDDVMEVPQNYLATVRRQNLQSMSIALGAQDKPGLDPRLLHYAEALGQAGVTGIRTVGRGAFPQLAYSWDGLIPRDLVFERPKGHFTAIEFDEPWTQIFETYRLIKQAIDRSGHA